MSFQLQQEVTESLLNIEGSGVQIGGGVWGQNWA